MHNTSKDLEKPHLYTEDELEKGICPKCGGEIIAVQAHCTRDRLIIRWECRSCSFTASTGQSKI